MEFPQTHILFETIARNILADLDHELEEGRLYRHSQNPDFDKNYFAHQVAQEMINLLDSQPEAYSDDKTPTFAQIEAVTRVNKIKHELEEGKLSCLGVVPEESDDFIRNTALKIRQICSYSMHTSIV